MKATDRHKLIERIKTLEGLTDDERAALLGLLRENKTYGLVWEDKPEEVEDRLRNELPVLVEDTAKALTDGGDDAPNHILIEGDNLEALTTLAYTHAGKIDVIYIDPPYNTGNKDFYYNDAYVDSDDDFRHSKWLSFMKKRLSIAKKLLNRNGFICISIDDNEQAALKLLCDEIFGYQNFINCISVKAKASSGASGGGEDKKFKKNIEYILIYAKSANEVELNFPKSATPLYEYIMDKKEKGITWSYTNVMLNPGRKEYVTSTEAGNGEEIKIYEVKDFEIISVSALAKKLNKSEEEIYIEFIDKIFTTENAQTSIRQRVANAVSGDGLYIAEYVPVSGRNKGKVTEVGFIGDTKRLVSYLKHTCDIQPDGVYKLEKIGTLWSDLSWSSVSKEGGVAFPSGKKPISLIKRIVSLCFDKDCVVLDFFAGSGSTGHAVMSINADDLGKRTFIAVTNNENKICETKTFPRLSNAIKGYGKTVGLTHNNLRYYRTDFVGRSRSTKNMRRLVALSTDMLCIKENLYDEKKKFAGMPTFKNIYRYFEHDDNKMLIIYDERYVDEIVKMIATVETTEPIKVYVFSPSEDPWEASFEPVNEKVTLCALPQAIYNTYKRILPKRKPQPLTAIVEEDALAITDEDENIGGLFGPIEEGGEA